MSDKYYTFFKRMGNKIFLRYKETGSKETKSVIVEDYKPTLYSVVGENEETELRNIYGKKVAPIHTDSMRDAKNYLDGFQDVHGYDIHGNTMYDQQFVIETFGSDIVYQIQNIRGAIIDIEVYSGDKSNINVSIRVRKGDEPEQNITVRDLNKGIYTDHEVYDTESNKWVDVINSSYVTKNYGFPHADKAEHPVTAICVYDTVDDVFYVFGDGAYTHNPKHEDIGDLDVRYIQFNSEAELLHAFVRYWNHSKFDFFSGWNTEFFDTPYLVNRITTLLGKDVAKKLSPFGRINSSEVVNDFGKEETKYELVGCPELDFLSLYKKHNFVPRESFKLDFIANAEIGAKKLSYEEEGNLIKLYKLDYQKYISYNIQDVNLIRLINNKMKLFDLTFALAYYCMCNYVDTLGTTRIWECLIAKYLYDRDVIIPIKPQASSKKEKFIGAFVKEPIPGKYPWVLSVDLNSLYPHLEQQSNIGPETRLTRDVVKSNLLNSLNEGHNLYEFIKSGDFDRAIDAVTIDHVVEQRMDDRITECCKLANVSFTPNKQFYDNSKMSFFSAIKRDLYTERKGYKKIMLGFEQKVADAKAEAKLRGLM